MISVYRKISGVETEICTLSAKQSEHKTAIRGLNEIQISITVDVMLPILEGDYIKLNGVNYTINRDVEYTIESDVKYSYDLVFEHPFYILLNKLYCNRITGHTSFTLTGKLRDFVELLVWCVNISPENPDGVDTGWTVGEIFNTEYKTLTFQDMYCNEVLNKLSDEFQVEYFFNNKQVNFVERIERLTDHVFEHGAGKGLYKLTQQNVDKEDTVTRLLVRGGNQNVSNGYADEEGYLKLPENYLEDFSEHAKVVERKKKFEEEFPRFVGSIATVSGENNKILTCPQIDFDIAAIAVGDNARINFLTGDLMGGPGYKFNWDNTNKQITLIEQEDETALADADGNKPIIPNANKKAKVGDQFNFTGVLMPASYVAASITRLREKGNKYLGLFSKKRVKFTLDIDHRYMRGKPELIVGDLVVISIPQRNFNQVIRITEIGKNLHTGAVSATVSNYLEENWEKYVESRVENVRNEILAKQANVRNTLESIFKDGIVTESELKSIEAILTNLSVERGQLNAQYLVVRGNVNLISKTPLETAWSNYQTAFVEVETAINNAITDKLISDAEKANIDNKISVYSTRTNEFATALENARVAIEDNKNQGVLDVVDRNKQYLQDQIDGVVDNWFYPYSPTLANYPASDWTTNTIKDRHVGDTFTNTAQAPATDAGKSWRFVKNGTVYSWTQIADSDAVLALQKAAQAQSTADGKSTTYLIQPSSYKFGDMWVLAADQTVNGIAYKSGEILTATQDSTTFVQAHWVKKVRYTDDSAVNNMNIGSRNFWLNSALISKSATTAAWSIASRDLTGLIENGAQVTMQFDINVDAPFNIVLYAANQSPIVFGTTLLTNLANFNLVSGKQTIKHTFNFDSSKPFIHIYKNSSELRTATVTNLMLGLGNKVTWSEAQEDIDLRINTAKQEALTAAGNAQTSANAANTAVGNLNTYVEGSFKDGVIEASEAKAIEKYINVVNTEKSNLEATYNTLYVNTYLEGTAKTDLLNAKVTYFGAVDTLLASISTAITDGKTTIAEKQAVDTNYSSYKTALASLQTAIENANKAIQTKLDTLSTDRVNNLQVGIDNVLKSSNTPIISVGSYLMGGYTSENFISGQTYTLMFFSSANVRAFISQNVQIGNAVAGLNRMVFTYSGQALADQMIKFYNTSSGYATQQTVSWACLYKGDVKAPNEWTESFKVVTTDIATNKLTAERAQLAADGYMKARYVRDWIQGSTTNNNNVWVEIKVLRKNGVNLALGKVPSHNGTVANSSSYPLTKVTDNDTATTNYTYLTATTPASLNYMEIDLGQVYYDIDYLHIWHGYSDNRTFYGTKTEISTDGVNWTPVFDSAKSGTYKETAAGNIISQRWNRVMDRLSEAEAKTKFQTLIDGGLIYAALMKLFDAGGSGNETAFISGLQGAGKNLPAFGCGGSYADALVNLAKTIFRHDGSGQLAAGKILWDAFGALNVGNFKIENGAIVGYSDNKDKIKLHTGEIPSLASLSSGQVITTPDLYSVAGEQMFRGESTTITYDYILTSAGSFTVVANTPITMYMPAVIHNVSGGVIASQSSNYKLYKDGALIGTYTSGTTITLTAGGAYNVMYMHTLQVQPSLNTNCTVTVSTLTAGYITYQLNPERSEIGKNGFYSFWSTALYFYFSALEGLKYKGALDIPGVLAKGRILSGAARDANYAWGAKYSAAGVTKISTGGYRVPVSCPDAYYSVFISPRAALRSYYLGTQTSTYFEVYFTNLSGAAVDTEFDFTVVGKNY